MLVRLMLFEAAKRYVWSLEEAQAGTEQYDLTVRLCGAPLSCNRAPAKLQQGLMQIMLICNRGLLQIKGVVAN